MQSKTLLTVLVALAASTSAWSVAPPQNLREAAQAAVLNSPEAQARWHAFREADEEIGVARGGLLPRVDFSAGAGHSKNIQRDAGLDASYRGNERTLTLRQMLFDGFGTISEMKRLGKARLVRYYELLDASENIALEAARAYLDVLRYREQVALAEDNYLQHQAAHDQLKRRAASGVGKRVDVDQAASRLALADINLTTAYANLHDVSARYLRIVGEQPAESLPAPEPVTQGFPARVDEALTTALRQNPALRASIENTEAAQYDLEARRAAFYPRVDFVARRDDYSNYQDAGSREDTRVELRLNYNILNGGSDLARHGQYRERKHIALDLREKACRDVRQTLSIAYNDTLRLKEQEAFLAMQVGLVEKTRTAYRDQFNIGQRTLLDLLNTQNEYFDARRAQVNARFDLLLAYLRSHAGMGNLLEVLGLKRIGGNDAAPERTADSPAGELCPPFVPSGTALDREQLAQKVREFAAAHAGPVAVKSAAPEPPAPAPLPDADIRALLDDWADAWRSGDAGRYLEHYGSDFVPENGASRAAWQRQREQRLAQAQNVRIDLLETAITSTGADNATVVFRQHYRAQAYADTTLKTLELRRENRRWRIVRERATPLVEESRR